MAGKRNVSKFLSVCLLLALIGLLQPSESSKVKTEMTGRTTNKGFHFNWREKVLRDDSATRNLAMTASKVLLLQNGWDSVNKDIGSWSNGNSVVLVLYHSSASRVADLFISEVSERRAGSKFISFRLASDSGRNSGVIEWSGQRNINSIVLVSGNDASTFELMTNISSNINFKWTSLLDTTEWLVVSSSYNAKQDLISANVNIDFITLIFLSDVNAVSISQKSRVEQLKTITTINFDKGAGKMPDLRVFFNLMSEDDKELDNQGQAVLRPNALRYLKTQKSLLAGMHLPISILPEEDKVFTRKENGSVTAYDGLSVAIAEMMASMLDISYEFVSPEDGVYGEVDDDGVVTGIIGQIARKEAAFSTMPIALLEDRTRVVDFVPISTGKDTQVSIIYRLPKTEENLDMTLLDIIQPHFILIHLGPILLIAAIGALAHVLTRSCSAISPQEVSRRDFRRLYSFPDHMCFHTDRSYASQSGRILRTSWAVFCVILCSAYSAYLATTFTVKPAEFAIRTLRNLVDNKDYTFGVIGTYTSLMTTLRDSSNADLRATWEKLMEFNKTDPSTLNTSFSTHVEKVLRGNYVFLHATNIETMARLIPDDYSDVRVFPQAEFEGMLSTYIAIPKNVSYTEEFYDLVLRLEDLGILDLYRRQYKYGDERYAPVETSVQNDKVNKQRPVSLGRILLLVYVTLSGIALGLFTLICEVFFVSVKTQFSGTSGMDQRSKLK